LKNNIFRGLCLLFARGHFSFTIALGRGESFPELAAVKGEGNDLILIEGAHRTTAYVALRWTKNLPAFIGTSPLMRDWAFY